MASRKNLLVTIDNEKYQGAPIPQGEGFPVGGRLEDDDTSPAYTKLPPKIKRRLRALKKLQVQCTHIEAKFYEEVHKLECNFNKFYSELYQKRERIVNGKYEPTDDECDYNDGSNVESSKEVEKVNRSELENVNPDVSGIPDFWFTIFKNTALLNDMVQPHDEPILKHLEDIRVKFLEKDPMGFILEFYFRENPFFNNKVLTKEYIMKCIPDEQDPLVFEGPEIVKCKGCVINWKNSMDITSKVIKKKQKHKSKGAVRTVTKVVKNDSFFNFFSPPLINDGCENDLDEDTQALLTTDFEIGHYFRERIVPNAVLYFTGEALDDEEYDDDDEEDDDEDDEEDDSDELSSESDNDSELYQRSSEGDSANVVSSAEQPQQPPDCKQQ